jgi:hypothetical protein
MLEDEQSIHESVHEAQVEQDVPPPVPPHRTPVDRPKSALSMDQVKSKRIPVTAVVTLGNNGDYRFYDEVDPSIMRTWRGSRERLLDRASASAQHMYANKLHRSMGSGLEQTKSPSSSDSSRKKKPVITPSSAIHRKTASPLWNQPPVQPQEHHDLLSSPEYPSTSSDLRMIPQPPPPPKAYYQHRNPQAWPSTGRGQLVATPLSHHPNAVLARRQRKTKHYMEDSDV